MMLALSLSVGAPAVAMASSSTTGIGAVKATSGNQLQGPGSYVIKKAGWHNKHGIWYHVKEDGTYSTGWKKLDWEGSTDWYHFNSKGVMNTGLFTDTDGRVYFLHNVSDGTQGHMLTGTHKINGMECHFEETPGHYLGHLKLK